MEHPTNKKYTCKMCGTEYDNADDALNCVEKCKQKRDMEALPALIDGTDWKQAQLEVMWKTVAVGTTPEEFAYFLNVAQFAGLNPFLREIYCWKSKSGKLTIMTGRDGYLKTAKKDPKFEGLHSMEVCENDEFEMGYENGAMEIKKHNITNFMDRGKIIGAWAKATFNGQLPIVAFASADEYKQPSKDVWKRTESAMMRKVPESMVLKRGAGISGLVTHEEMEVPERVSNALGSGEIVDAEYAEVSDGVGGAETLPVKRDAPAEQCTPELVDVEHATIDYIMPGEDSYAMQHLKEYRPKTIILNDEKTRFKVGKFTAEISGDGSQIWCDAPKFGRPDFDVDACVPCLIAGLVRAHGVPFVNGKYGFDSANKTEVEK
jgi:hypothetical protein